MAVKVKAIGRKRLFEIGTLVTPDTLFRWYRELVAKKYDGSKSRRPGRPRTGVDIEELVLLVARDNPRWGYTRIRGELFNLGREIARNTIKRILLDNGFEPIRRNHQGLSNRLIKERQGTVDMDSAVVRHERLGGVLNYTKGGLRRRSTKLLPHTGSRLA
jgi:hypothetical protein